MDGTRDGAAWPGVPVFFATTDGQTARVAERLAEHLREEGLESEAIDVASKEGRRARSWERVEGAALCASIHYGGHQRSARRFAAAHLGELAKVPSLFVSVCLAIRSENAVEREEARNFARSFGERTGFEAERVVPVAGRLAYTRYGWLKRLVMKRIAKAEGGSTDTSRDHEYTDWDEVRRLAGELAERVRARRGGSTGSL